MTLPKFKYHPDPIATGSVSASDEICLVCEEARGYILRRVRRLFGLRLGNASHEKVVLRRLAAAKCRLLCVSSTMKNRGINSMSVKLKEVQ